MDSEFDDEMLAELARIRDEFEDKTFEALRTGGTAMMDQYEAHVNNMLRMLREHRPHCRIFNEHRSEMCPSFELTGAVERMETYDLQRSLVMALVMLARRE